jgi:signal transduction histidine kinase/putative methionine-R-sulfoxide reductase with GAF domain
MKSKHSDFLLEVSKELIKEREFPDLSRKVLRIAKGHFGLVNCGILLYDPSIESLYVKSFSGFKKSVKALRIALGKGVTGRCAKIRKTVYVPDVSKEAKFIRVYASTKSELVIPLVSEKKLLGVLNFENRKAHGFSKEDITLLEAFASIVSIALGNALLFENISNRDRQKNELIDIAKAVSESMEKERAIGRLVSLGGRLVSADRCAISMYGKEKGEFVAQLPGYGVGKEKLRELHYSVSEAPITKRILKTGTIFMANEAQKISSPLMKEFVRKFNIKHLIISPLRTSKEITGLLFVARGKKGKPFTEDERDILIIYSSLAAALLKRIQMFSELSEKRRQLEKMTKELRNTNEELHSISFAKKNLISNISHELRTPLVSIKGYTDLLFYGKLGEINKKQEISLLAMKRNAERLIKEVDNLIDISSVELEKSSGEEKELVNIRFVVEKSIELVYPFAEQRKIRIKEYYDDEYLIVEAEREKLTRAFLNILENAIKFNKQNGKVTVHCFRQNGKAITEIKDTGIGIPEKYHKLIFDRFFQVESSSKRGYAGSGIGLSLSLEIVKLFEGDIQVISKPKKGSTFIVSFPAKN